jgi:pullulanase/glycogen debranching enzyme
MVQRGLKNPQGEKIGFDHLLELGINVVHLMPVQEFLHYPDDEWQAAFKNDPFMTEHGVNLENYDWGYRTTHAFAIESRFRKRGTENGEEREQFRDLVAEFHKAGIAVIVDIVPNHTGENMDGRSYLFNFGAIDTDYYYRTNDQLQHIGPYGNEVKFEDRPMSQRWLIDQCKHLIDEFGIDGFRIDLAGQIDKQTLIKLRHAMGPDVIIYGEPWIPPSDPEVAASPDWGWYKKDAPITFFQDDARNAFKGPTANPTDKIKSRGFAGGDGDVRGKAMQALLNSFDDEQNPNMGINYLDIHDNWALADQFATREWDGRKGVDEGPFRIAAGLLFTSLGPIVLHGGTEFMRSKGSAGLEERWMQSASGKLLYHGKSDTYNMLTPNLFLWDNIGRGPEDANVHCDYRQMLAYWKGLVALRRSDIGSVFRVGAKPAENYYRWIAPDDTKLLGYVVAGRILVLVNTSHRAQAFPAIHLPIGPWQLISNGVEVDHIQGVSGDDLIIEGGRNVSLIVPPTTMKIWAKKP